MSASINSVQTRKMAHHFPIRAGQPDIQITVHFASTDDKHNFQNFVREHQRNSQIADYTIGSTALDNGSVVLNWPERNIINWTGYIVNMPIKESRFEYAPRVTFGIALIESMMSTRTTSSSLGNSFWTVAGVEIGQYIPFDPEVDFRLPTPSPSDTPDPGQEERGLIGTVRSWLGGFLS